MPEIAEVRTVARTLNRQIVGKNIIGIDIIYDKIIENDLTFFKNNILNKTIKKVENFGKWLMFDLGEYTLLSHLRMEGKYFLKDSKDNIEKHEHIIFHLNDNLDLRYHDTRKFGKMNLVLTKDVFNTEEIKKLGIEPDSEKLTGEYIYENVKNKKIPIKQLLLDQTMINGLGNIYVDEVLFASNINPTRLGISINKSECENIKNACYEIITKATSSGGTTIRSYTSSLGVKGNYQDYLKVHTKENEKCLVCGNEIKKIRVGGRGTYFCPTCQK